ncbi:MAG TPA: aldolase/citrate lyase family protein [Burkholderiales bacterium]|nr:aldolase/citrate lyase family protein [Burkholderiales bacterium]
MNNRIRSALVRGDTLTGIILFTGSPMITELAAAAGVDFVIIDMEHSALDLDGCAHVIRAADAAGITPFVRVPEVNAALIKKILNLGAAGIAVPHADRDNCAAALRAVKYAPDGERGACAIVRSAGYAPPDWNAHVRNANREVMVIPLIEDKETLADFDALAAMPGLEVFFLGPTDLSISLGVSHATFDEPALGAALDTVVAAARRHGKHVMTTIGNRLDPEYGRAVARRGVRLLVLGTDGHLFLDACRRMNSLKSG